MKVFIQSNKFQSIAAKVAKSGCFVVSVECAEHGANSAIYEK